MNSEQRITRISKILSIILLLAFGMSWLGGDTLTATAEHATMPSHGMVCTSNSSATFTLTAKDGNITMPDGNVVYMWGFSEGDQPFQHPGPVLCVTEGDMVTIVLHNTLTEDISIIFPGQEGVLANGLPAEPQFDSGGQMVSLTNTAPPGSSITYQFIAKRAGTFLYQSGTEAAVQVNMGLFGALVVQPLMGPGFAYNDALSQFNPDAEFINLLSEIDPMLHVAKEQGLEYDMTNYRARYWLMNGRSFPDTVAENGAPWLPNQPYSTLVHIYPYDPVDNPLPALIRYLNVGTINVPHHPHGNHGRIIAQDGNLLIGPGGEDLSYEKFTVNVSPGQTLDATFDWRDVEEWHPIDNPIPVTIPQLQNLTYGQFFSGSPYLGNTDQLPVGQQALNQCGEYYHIAHNHALQQITAWGVVLSGQITFTRIDPPLPNNCPTQ